VGKKYTKEEISRIQTLNIEGFTDREIAVKLGRTEDSIRNMRFRYNVKSEIKSSFEALRDERDSLQTEVVKLKRDVTSLQLRKQEITKALQTDETTLSNRIKATLREMKYRKPELFRITGEEQLTRLTGELASQILKWLIS